MADNVVKVPQQPWFEDSDLTLEFPAGWDVRPHRMRGHNLPPLDEAGIRRAFANPIGTKPIHELAAGKQEVAIIFDDLARPTKVDVLLPYVLEELAAAGIPDRAIRLVCALGMHGAHTRYDFAKKLGPDIPGRFPVYNHNPYENCVRVGTTSLGTSVDVNAEVMACDLKIAIGSILPHPLTGWGGGGKIVLPGVCGIETITANHRQPLAIAASGQLDRAPILGKLEGNQMRQDAEEAARLAGLDVVVNALINEKRDVVDLLVGEVGAVWEEGARRGRDVYATTLADASYDVVVANAYAKANEAAIAVRRVPTWGDKQVTLVVIANTPEGQVPHYLLGTFGNQTAGRLWYGMPGLPPGVGRLIVYSRYPEKAASHWFGNAEQVEWRQHWGEVIEDLRATHPAGAKVAVFPDLTIQYFPELVR